jgi:hypothetical protein
MLRLRGEAERADFIRGVFCGEETVWPEGFTPPPSAGERVSAAGGRPG